MRCKVDFDKFSFENSSLDRASWMDVTTGSVSAVRNISCDLLFDRNPEIEADIKELQEKGVAVFLRIKV